ncbi:MAG: beta-eliminating lyase-related protein, partial [Pseudomonadota bacterium]|nr:beta-eliminating lyase-related protein [Pseudomonadota bacterium]
RQAGIIAAAGIHALEHHVDRLADDNANARRFADLITDVPGVAIEPETVETNIVFFDVAGTGSSAVEIVEGLAGLGVRIGAMGETTMRAVTHLDVDSGQIEEAAGALRRIVAAA